MTFIVAAVALTAGFVAEATGGQLISGSDSASFTAVSIDSRTTAPGNLFVALKGERVDGHEYVGAAVERGASGVLVSDGRGATGAEAVIRVGDTLAALQALGRQVRRQSGAKVVAITGSAGKTTTKELMADLLAEKFRVFRNRGNLNNHIGLPLSLTELSTGPEIAVVELGMNHAGEIRLLVGLAEPDVRVWTNVGDAHIGHFGSREAVADAKAEILEAATPDTLAVVNADDALASARARTFAGRLVTFGVDTAAAIRAVDVQDRGFDGTTARVETATGAFELRLSMPGRAHLQNALAAIAVAREFGIETGAMAARLAAARPLTRRGSESRLAIGARLIDDSYNASPAAMTAMLRALAATPAAGRRVAVLGEMRELGDTAEPLHESCGRTAAECGVDLLVAVGGPAANGLITGAVAAGLSTDRTRRFATAAEAAESVVREIAAGDLVLVKGSRGTRMDVIADALQAGGVR